MLKLRHPLKTCPLFAATARAQRRGTTLFDEERSKGSTIPEGVPKNRPGHGIPEKC